MDQVPRAVWFAMVPVVVAFSFVVFVFYRSRREAYFKQKEAELKLTMTELELNVLRAQMNPHFIFNCLNSIYHYMQANESSRASDYLVKFSKLIRHVLETSYNRMILLQDELQMLAIYLDLEQLRTRNGFTYSIVTDSSISDREVMIPPLLLQPVVENAIWHGTGGSGHIEIRISRADAMLMCTIDDSGKEPELESGSTDLKQLVESQSRGMSLIAERLLAVNKLYQCESGYSVLKLSSGGTRVTLTLPYED